MFAFAFSVVRGLSPVFVVAPICSAVAILLLRLDKLLLLPPNCALLQRIAHCRHYCLPLPLCGSPFRASRCLRLSLCNCMCVCVYFHACAAYIAARIIAFLHSLLIIFKFTKSFHRCLRCLRRPDCTASESRARYGSHLQRRQQFFNYRRLRMHIAAPTHTHTHPTYTFAYVCLYVCVALLF